MYFSRERIDMHFYFTIIDWLEKLMLPCLYKVLLKADCPGCGFQRSVFHLLRGDLASSVAMYWATIPILLMFLFCLAHIRYRFQAGGRILIFLYSINGILIICQYIYGISQHQ